MIKGNTYKVIQVQSETSRLKIRSMQVDRNQRTQMPKVESSPLQKTQHYNLKVGFIPTLLYWTAFVLAWCTYKLAI